MRVSGTLWLNEGVPMTGSLMLFWATKRGYHELGGGGEILAQLGPFFFGSSPASYSAEPAGLCGITASWESIVGQVLKSYF